MTLQEILYVIMTLASAIAAILAWIAQIRWSDKYRDSKEAQITSIERELAAIKNIKEEHTKILEGQIEQLRSLTPEKVNEFFVVTKANLEKYNDYLKSQVDELIIKLGASDSEIDGLKKTGSESEKSTVALQLENQTIKAQLRQAQNELARIQQTSLTDNEIERVTTYVSGSGIIWRQPENQVDLSILNYDPLKLTLDPSMKNIIVTDIGDAEEAKNPED
jgi:hypothetical protein